MQKPMPVGEIIIDSDNAEFWRRVRERELAVQKCAACSNVFYPPRGYCPNCLSAEHEWLPVSGQGEVYTHVTFEHAFRADLKDHLPYTVALVDLDEGVRMWSNVVGTEAADIHIGMKVELVYEEAEGEVLPRFKAR